MIAGTLEIQMMANFARLIEDVRQVQQKVDAGMSAIERSVGLAGKALGGLAAAFSVTKLVGYADAWGQLSSRMNQATGSMTAGDAAMRRLMDVSNRVYKPIADTAELFIRTSESLKQMGYTTAETVDMVETLSYGLTVSSASADKTKSVIDAWSKSMLQGKMTMGEYQTVISGAPALQKAMADSLGVTIAGLQEMVGKGQLSADKMMLVTKQMEELGKQADAMPVTVSDAWTKMTNSITQYAGELNKGTGATSLLTGALGFMANNVGPIVTMLTTMVALAVAGWLTTVTAGATAAGGAFVVATGAVKGFMAAMGPWGWAILAIGAATSAWQMFGDKAKEALGITEGSVDKAIAASKKLGAGISEQVSKLVEEYEKLLIAKERALGIGPTQEQSLEQRYAEQGNAILALSKRYMDATRGLGEFAKLSVSERKSIADAAQTEIAKAAMNMQEMDERIGRMNKARVKEYLSDAARMTEAQKQAAEMAKAQRLHEAALISARGDASEIAKINAQYEVELGNIRAKYSKDAVKASNQEAEAYKSLITSIQAKISEEKAEREAGVALTDSQKMRIKLATEYKDKLTGAHKTAAAALLDELEAQEKLTKADKEGAEAQKAYYEARTKMVEAIFNSAAELEKGNKELRAEIELIGKSAREQANILRARREAVILIKEATLAEIERFESQHQRMSRTQIALAEEIAQLKERNALLDQKQVAEENSQLVAGQEQQWLGFFQSIDQTARQTWTNVFEDGAGSFKRLGQTLKASVLDVLYQMTLRKWVINIAMGLFGGGSATAASAASSVLGEGGGIGSLMGLGGNMSSLWNLVSNGLNVGSMGGGMLSGLARGAYSMGMEGASNLIRSFQSGMMSTASWSSATVAAQAGGTQLAGLIAGSLMNGFAGYGLSKWLSGGYSAGGWVNTAAGIASMIPGIGPIAGVIGGVINRAFGRKLKDSGIEGAFGGDTGFEGQQYEFYKGGWFRSDKTTYKPLEEATRQGFADQFLGMKEAVEAMGDSLGLGSGLLSDFVYKMKISLKGLSEEEASKKIAEEFEKLGNAMAEAVLTTNEYAKADESRLETLTRLSQSLATVNEWLGVTGGKLYEVGLAGADMASQLIDAFGGSDAFNSVTSAFYDKYFTDAQKVENIIKQMGKAFTALGFESVPKTRDELLAMINAQDLATEEGRKLYASLIGLANVMDTVFSVAEAKIAMLRDLDVELLRARGQEREALELERAKRLKEIEQYGEEAVSKLREIWAAEDAAATAEAVKSAMDTARQAAVEARNQALKVLQYATDRELKQLAAQREALNLQRTVAKEQLTTTTALYDLLHQSVRDLYGAVDSTAEMQAQAGREFISRALSAALGTGYLPERAALSEAISAARKGITDGAYISNFERERDMLVLAGQLADLEAVTGKQKSIQEQQLDAVDREIDLIDRRTKQLQDQLAAIQDLIRSSIDALNGDTVATKSVEEAVRDIYKMLGIQFGPKDTTPGGSKGPVGPDVPVIGGSDGSYTPPPKPGAIGDGRYYREVETPYGNTFVVEDSQHLRDVDKWLDAWRGTGDVRGMLDAARSGGDISMSDIAIVMGWSQSDLVNVGKDLGIPKFATGGMHVGGFRIVGEEGPELEATGPARIWNASQTRQMLGSGASGDALLSEVRALRDEVRGVRDEARGVRVNTGGVPQLVEQVDQLSEGGNALRVDVINKVEVEVVA